MWNYHFPTRVFFGKEVISKNSELLASLGRKAFIVTGRGGSASRNGSLNDVCRALESCSVAWEIFADIEANPSLETVRRGAEQLQKNAADFVIGIGGGSPLDAAKAISALAVNDLSDEELWNVSYTQALPIAAVPTTAGTGSEVTAGSIITSHRHRTKKNVGSSLVIPRLAFLDPGYTVELPEKITIDTAVDAYSHALESYLTIKTNPVSEMLAREALSLLGKELPLLAARAELTIENRANLLYASLLAGLTISITGTSIPHALGYSFTYFKEIPHGRANGLIMPAWMKFNLQKSTHPKIQESLRLSGLAGYEDFRELMHKLCGPSPAVNREEQSEFIDKLLQAGNFYSNLITPSPEEAENILREVLAN